MLLKINFFRHKIFLALFALSIVCIGGSLFRGAFHLDPLHWSLMFSNAQDLANFRKPYAEIYIQYGFLTTLVHSFGYVLKNNLLSLIFITAVFYYFGIVALYCLSKRALSNNILALKIVVIAILFHPIAIYPWPNYIAFPFLIGGIYLLVFNQNYGSLISGGILLGLSVMSRENLIFSVCPILIIFYIIDYQSNNKNILLPTKKLLQTLIGFSMPVILFFSYLHHEKIFNFWFQLSYEVPVIFSQIHFQHVTSIEILNPFLRTILSGFVSLDFRWIFIALVIFTNILILIFFLTRNRNYPVTPEIAKLACAAIILLSSALHAPEIFRIATGSILGLIPTAFLIRNMRFFDSSFYFFVLVFTFTLFWGNPSLMYFPSINSILESEPVILSKYFSGQRWNSKKIDYYQQISQTFLDIKRFTSCSISHQYNYTGDGYIKILSPFTQRQMAPWMLPIEISNLRPELNFRMENNRLQDTLLIMSAPPESSKLVIDQIPSNYYLYRVVIIPDIYYLPGGGGIYFILPKSCIGG